MVQFQEPCDVEGAHCRDSQAHSVRSLLKLEANCSAGGQSFRLAGLELRRMMDDWISHVEIIELAMQLEDQFGVAISDEELEDLETIEDMATLVSRKAPDGDATNEAVSIAAASLPERSSGLPGPEILPNSSIRKLFSQYAIEDT